MQIQRIQTLWLVLALGCLIAFLVLPFGEMTFIDNGLPFDASLISYDFLGVIIPLGLAILLAVIAIFSYKDPSFQTSLCGLTLMMELVTAGIVIYILCDRATDGAIITWRWETAFLLASIVLTILAICGIRHDIKLLRSADRLR